MLAAAQVRAVRKLMGWTQRDLAARLSVSPSTIAFIENNQKRHSRDIADRFWHVIEQAGIEFSDGDLVLKTPLPENEL
jgi:transcriptional regulator with XRE-family HTH domain